MLLAGETPITGEYFFPSGIQADSLKQGKVDIHHTKQ